MATTVRNAPLSFGGINDDAMIHIFGFLDIPDILALRQTSKRLRDLSRLRIVWQRAFIMNVSQESYPRPSLDTSLTAPELERLTLRAVKLGYFWRTPSAIPRRSIEFTASSGTGISDIHFLPGRDGKLLLTVSKGIWSIITCWHIGGGPDSSATPRKIADWSPRGAIVTTRLVVNSEPQSTGRLAISLDCGGRHKIEIMSIVFTEAHGVFTAEFTTIWSLETTFKPILLQGDMMVVSDDSCDAQVINWKSGSTATLRGSEEPTEQRFQYNRCLKVVLFETSVIVMRARSMELFSGVKLSSYQSTPLEYHPVARHSCGWIDGVALNIQTRLTRPDESRVSPMSFVMRAENDNPWASDRQSIDLYSFQPNPAYRISGESNPATPQSAMDSSPKAPYLFPPVHVASLPSVRGFLRCTDIILGRHGTAIWVQPRPARNVDLTALDVHASETQAPYIPVDRGSETVMAAIFPGALLERHPQENFGLRKVWAGSEDGSTWTAIAYDEERGRIALSSSRGRITLLEL